MGRKMPTVVRPYTPQQLAAFADALAARHHVPADSALFWSKRLDHPNPKRFWGRICLVHPSAGGERRRLNGECIQCHAEKPPENAVLPEGIKYETVDFPGPRPDEMHLFDE